MAKNELVRDPIAKTNDSVAAGFDVKYNMFLGSPCRHGHGVDGKNLRYKSRGECVECVRKTVEKCRHQNNKRDLTAINAFNDRQAEKDDYYD